MKKLSVLAIVALFVAGTALAGQPLLKAPSATFAPGTGALGPTTTNNDDSCDIGNAPAATLLLPYFNVDLGSAGTGRTTLFSVTNVSPYSQIAHVVVWTDWSFPVLDFNIFLTGYDVQPINLYDVIARGLIGSTTGTGIGSTASPNARTASVSAGVVVNPIAQPNRINGAGTISGTNPNAGTQPFSTADFNGGNPNFDASASTSCAAGRLPGQLPQALANDVRLALSTGMPTGAAVSCQGAGAPGPVGSNHGANTAIGYVTIDVAATCSVFLPTDAGYFASTTGILFDNVLIGDYQDVNQNPTTGNYSGGAPLVAIRAIPEGGTAGTVTPTNLPFTFYDRYTISTTVPRTIDRRQPLPSAFAARWISGATAVFDTQYKIWREGFTGATAVVGGTTLGNNALACGAAGVQLNASIPYTEIVRFDEHENATTLAPVGGIIVSPPPVTPTTGIPETGEYPVSSSIFPQVAGSGDVGGWMYFNLNNGGDITMTGAGINPQYSAQRTGFQLPVPPNTTGSPTTVIPGTTYFYRDVSQNWVIAQLFASGRFAVDEAASWLGNGCSAPFPPSSAGAANTAVNRIAPAGGVLVCSPPNPPGTGGGTSVPASTAGQCTGSNVTP